MKSTKHQLLSNTAKAVCDDVVLPSLVLFPLLQVAVIIY